MVPLLPDLDQLRRGGDLGAVPRPPAPPRAVAALLGDDAVDEAVVAGEDVRGATAVHHAAEHGGRRLRTLYVAIRGHVYRTSA